MNYLYGFLFTLVIVLLSIKDDIKYKKIKMTLLITGYLGAIILRICYLKDYQDALLGCIPGLCLLPFSRISNQAVGYGDGLMIAFVGLCLGFRRCLTVFIVSLTLISVYGLILFIFKRGNRHTEVAYMPWLCIAIIVGGILWI